MSLMTGVIERSFSKGDRIRVPFGQLLNPDGTPINLTGQTVAFRMVDGTGAVKINNAAAVLVDATVGKIRYDWAEADVDTPGQYWAWFIRTSGGLTEHFPAGHVYKIIIEAEV